MCTLARFSAQHRAELCDYFPCHLCFCLRRHGHLAGRGGRPCACKLCKPRCFRSQPKLQPASPPRRGGRPCARRSSPRAAPLSPVFFFFRAGTIMCHRTKPTSGPLASGLSTPLDVPPKSRCTQFLWPPLWQGRYDGCATANAASKRHGPGATTPTRHARQRKRPTDLKGGAPRPRACA